jgi:hypothetical protein
MLGGVFVCVSLAALHVNLLICLGEAKFRCLNVSLYDTHEVESMGHK